MSPTRRIVIHDYDIEWPAEFNVLAGHLHDALGDSATRIDHIGSTAGPGLSAKDIIDVQISVVDLDDPRIANSLVQIGATETDMTLDHVPSYDLHRPQAWHKRSFRPPSTWRATHLHVREVGRPNQRYALLFRDYLRHSPATAAAYAQTKQALAHSFADDVDSYYAIKDPVCDVIITAAERWAVAVAWMP